MCIRTRTQGKTDYNFNSFLFPLFPPVFIFFFLNLFMCVCVCACVRVSVRACVRACNMACEECLTTRSSTALLSLTC